MADAPEGWLAVAPGSLALRKSGIDTRVMSQDEIKECADRLQGRLPKDVRRQPLRTLMIFCSTLLVAAVVGIAIAANSWGEQGAIAVGSLAFMLGWGAMSLVPKSIFDSARRRWLASYLDEIRYAERLEEKRFAQEEFAVRGPSDDDGPRSTRQLQHEWYGDHSELGWHDRVLGETLGIPDADTYTSNFLEHDKD